MLLLLSSPHCCNFMPIMGNMFRLFFLRLNFMGLNFMSFLPVIYNSLMHILLKLTRLLVMIRQSLIIKVSGFCPVLDFSWQNMLKLTVAVFFLHEMLTYYQITDVFFQEIGWNLFTVPFEKCLNSIYLCWLLNQLFKFNSININFYMKND